MEYETSNTRSGFHRLRNAQRFYAAKKRTDEYKNKKKPTDNSKATMPKDATESKTPMPQDVAELEEKLNSHPDLAQKSRANIEMYHTYEFLLHTNWTHDAWMARHWIKSRDLNLMKVSRAGAPVWAAAKALVGDNAQAKRTLHIFY